MAIHANSTTAPAHPLLPFVHRPSPPVNDPRSAEELLEEIRRTIEGQVGVPKSGETQTSEVCSVLSTPRSNLLPALFAETGENPLLPKSGERSDLPHAVASDVPRARVGLLKSEESENSGLAQPLLPAPAPLPSLTSALSRRRAIFGGLVIAAAPVAALPALASPSLTISAEAAALGAEFDVLSARFDAARAACREADARYVRPPVPERLFWQKEDPLHFGFKDPGRHLSDRRWWGYPHDIEWLTGLKLAYLSGNPDVEARARGLEILDLHERYRVAVEAAEDAAGVTAASDAWDVDATAYFAFVERLVALQTADPAVIRLKARVIASDLIRHKGLDDYLAQAIEDNPSEVETLALSLVRDLVAREGLLPQGVTHA